MQTNRYKIYSYPYLADYSKDYVNTTFSIDVVAKWNQGNGTVTFHVTYKLTNEEINDLIAKGMVKVVARFSCKPIGYVDIAAFNIGHNTLDFDVFSMDVDGDVDIDVFLVANEDMVITNKDLSKEWSSLRAVAQKGNVIGESETRVITVDHSQRNAGKSIISFAEQKSLKDDGYYSINLDGERIVFGLSSKMYKQYSKVCKKNPESVIVNFLVPAFASIFEQMAERDEDGEVENDFNRMHKNKEWYKVLSHKYEDTFNDDPTKRVRPSVEAAQILLKVDAGRKTASSQSLAYIVKAIEGGIKNG